MWIFTNIIFKVSHSDQQNKIAHMKNLFVVSGIKLRTLSILCNCLTTGLLHRQPHKTLKMDSRRSVTENKTLSAWVLEKCNLSCCKVSNV